MACVGLAREADRILSSRVDEVRGRRIVLAGVCFLFFALSLAFLVASSDVPSSHEREATGLPERLSVEVAAAAKAQAGGPPADRRPAGRDVDPPSLAGWVVDTAGVGIPDAVVVPGPAGLAPAFASESEALYHFDDFVREARRSPPSLYGAAYMRTGSEGAFEFPLEVAEGVTKLLAVHPDRGIVVIGLDVFESRGRRIELPRRPVIWGQVRGNNAGPDCKVQLYSSGRLRLTIQCDPRGRFRSPPLPSAEYLVTTAPPNQARPESVVVPPGGPWEDAYLELDRPYPALEIVLADLAGGRYNGGRLGRSAAVRVDLVATWSKSEPSLDQRAVNALVPLDSQAGTVSIPGTAKAPPGVIGIWAGYRLLAMARVGRGEVAVLEWIEDQGESALVFRLSEASERAWQDPAGRWRVALGVLSVLGNQFESVLGTEEDVPTGEPVTLRVPAWLAGRSLLARITVGDGVHMWRTVELPSDLGATTDIAVEIGRRCDVEVVAKGFDAPLLAVLGPDGSPLVAPGWHAKAVNGRSLMRGVPRVVGSRIVAWARRGDSTWFGSSAVTFGGSSAHAEVQLKRGREIELTVLSKAAFRTAVRVTALDQNDEVVFDERATSSVTMGRRRFLWVPNQADSVQLRGNAGELIGQASIVDGRASIVVR